LTREEEGGRGGGEDVVGIEEYRQSKKGKSRKVDELKAKYAAASSKKGGGRGFEDEEIPSDDDDDGGMKEGLQFYEEIKKKSVGRKKKKNEKKELKQENNNNNNQKFKHKKRMRGVLLSPHDPGLMEAEGKRGATKKMLDNRGLTRHRPKEQRNPRVRQRQKYDKALKKRRTQVSEFTEKRSMGYGGEATGLKKHLIKSVAL